MRLPGGNYRVLFRLKVGDNTGTEPVARLYVRGVREGAEQVLASAILRPFHFSSPNAWEVFELPVEVRDDDEDLRVGVEFFSGTTDLWCDWIRVVPAGTSVAGDLKVLGGLRAYGDLALGDLEAKSTDTVLRLQSKTGCSRLEFREWAREPEYGFDLEYDADANALVLRAQDGPNGPKEWERVQRATGAHVYYRDDVSADIIRSFVRGEAYPRFILLPNGTMRWWNGGDVPDVSLERPGPGKLRIAGGLVLDRPDEGWSLESRVRGQNRFICWSHGRMRWLGPDGATLCELQPVEGGLVLTGKLDAQEGLEVGGTQVIGPDRTLRNVRASCLNIRELRRGAGEPAVSALVEPHVEGRQLVPLAVRAQVGSTVDFRRSWDVLDGIWDGKRIVAWSVYIAFSEETGLTEAVVKAIDEEGLSYPVARASEEGDKDGSVKIWALEC